jgi:hypothetical protein
MISCVFSSLRFTDLPHRLIACLDLAGPIPLHLVHLFTAESDLSIFLIINHYPTLHESILIGVFDAEARGVVETHLC